MNKKIDFSIQKGISYIECNFDCFKYFLDNRIGDDNGVKPFMELVFFINFVSENSEALYCQNIIKYIKSQMNE